MLLRLPLPSLLYVWGSFTLFLFYFVWSVCLSNPLFARSLTTTPPTKEKQIEEDSVQKYGSPTRGGDVSSASTPTASPLTLFLPPITSNPTFANGTSQPFSNWANVYKLFTFKCICKLEGQVCVMVQKQKLHVATRNRSYAA